MKEMSLLGAGASVDAGLESSTGLTKAIAEHLGRGAFRNLTGQLLHAVIGAMIQHDASGGADAFAIQRCRTSVYCGDGP